MSIETRDQPRLAIPTALQVQLRAYAAAAYPHEACGLLLGRADGEQTRVERVTKARNLAVERARDRYTLDPKDFLAAELEAAGLGLDVVGVWHSHPDHPAEPSATDLAAAWSGYSYVIVSVQDGRAVQARSWRLHQDRFVEERLLS
jgi:proteasome lid subunit RPN8/RPN11